MRRSDERKQNVDRVVPFLRVSAMEQSLWYYVDGLGFVISARWVVEDRIRWCMLELGGGSLMLQEYPRVGHGSWVASGKVGEGVSLYFLCKDAVVYHREVESRGIGASEPQVGNGMWVTGLRDPDGYQLYFESVTDTPEDTKLSAVEQEAM